MVHLFTCFRVAVLLTSDAFDFGIGLERIGLRLRFGIRLIEFGQALFGTRRGFPLIEEGSRWCKESDHGDGQDHEHDWRHDEGGPRKNGSLRFGVLGPRRLRRRVRALARRGRFRARSTGKTSHG